jgi:hypothetical protein
MQWEYREEEISTVVAAIEGGEPGRHPGCGARSAKPLPCVEVSYTDSYIWRPTLPAVQPCIVCGWQPATRKGRCNACRLFLFRHGQDKKIAEVQRGWERAIDKAFDLKDWR